MADKGAVWEITRFIVKSHSGKPSKHHEIEITAEGAYLISYGKAVAYRSHDGARVETYGEEGFSKTTRRYAEHFLLPSFGAPFTTEARAVGDFGKRKKFDYFVDGAR